jgi:hypothetical protein
MKRKADNISSDDLEIDDSTINFLFIKPFDKNNSSYFEDFDKMFLFISNSMDNFEI